MTTTVHFIDVEQGNMVLIQCSDGTNFMVDCNVTESNKNRVLRYVENQIGQRGHLRAFICTHRDADHMRGVRALHQKFPIQEIWDSDHPGTSTDSDEYKTYMQLRRDVGRIIINKRTRYDYGSTGLRMLSAKDNRLPDNANDQGIVLKVEELNSNKSRRLGSTMLTGDSSYAVWKDGIMKDYTISDLSSDILMAAHHGSLDFFDDPNNNRYETHASNIAPAMTVVSVGPNNYGHPDPKALSLYEKHSSGSSQGNKVLRTDKRGTIKLTLASGGSWSIS